MVKKYSHESEITENSIIMIEFEDGVLEPYYVAAKRTGNISGATMLLGYLLEYLIECPELWPVLANCNTDRYYIKNNDSNGKDSRVKSYRPLKEEEKVAWCQKIPPEQKGLIKVLFK